MSIHPETSIGHVHLAVGDLERSVAFYTESLGFRLLSREGGRVALGAAEGGASLLLLSEERDAPPRPPGTTGLYHLAILLPSRADLGRSLLRLAEMRYPTSGASDHAVSEAVYLDDPEGNGIELYRDRPRAEWPREDEGVAMGNAPLDTPGILAEAEREGRPWAGLPAGTCIGHVHLHVGDLDAAERFYIGALGLGAMQRFGGALFVSAGGYHHHVGLNTWAGVGAPPPPPGSRGLREFALRLPDPAARDDVVRRLRDAEYEAEERDGEVAATDPAGNRVALTAPSAAARSNGYGG